MSDEELFRTGRRQSLRSLTPAYLPGASVYLQREVQGFDRGSLARVVSVESTRSGQLHYQLTVSDQKMWAFEADIRPTPPGELGAGAASGAEADFGPTQRLHTLTLSQRMTALGPNATQRMHALTQEERLRKLVQTNRLRTLGPEAADVVSAAPAAGSAANTAATAPVSPLAASADAPTAAPTPAAGNL